MRGGSSAHHSEAAERTMHIALSPDEDQCILPSRLEPGWSPECSRRLALVVPSVSTRTAPKVVTGGVLVEFSTVPASRLDCAEAAITVHPWHVLR